MFALEARNLTKTFGGLTAVSDLTIEVSPGEVLGLIGPNGAGKTTLFNCLTGFLPVDSGEIKLYDRDITRVKPHDICRLGLTRTFQIVRPFVTVSVLENILVGALLRRRSMASARELAAEVLDITGLGALAERVVVINYGQKIASGLPEEVVKNELVIEAYLGKEFLNAQG